MRKETVPIDMSSEQKTILGIFSKRQLIYLAVGGIIVYSYVPSVFKLFSNYLVGLIASLVTVIPIAIIVFILGFLKKTKLHLNFDQYLMIKTGYKSQIGKWRKGTKAKDWMVNK